MGGSETVLSGLATLLGRIEDTAIRDRFLLDPAFIEGLHEASPQSITLADWHQHLACPEPAITPLWPGASHGAHHLGNALLRLLLRDDPYWRGQVLLQTDLAGRLRFPCCDWSMALWPKRAGPGFPYADREILCSLTRSDVRVAVASRPDDPLLVMSRDQWLRMFESDERLDRRQMRFAEDDISLRLQLATGVPGWNVRYDPVGIRDLDRHGGMTGGFILATLNAVAQHAPAAAAEFDALIRTVRAWDLPVASAGTLQSFSDPTLPGVMGINIPYSADEEPQVCPFCFAWFGHELGHTKSYLIETILHVRGHSLTSACGQSTGKIPRYGRTLPMRTLLQIPYTHLYEWLLLIGFVEGEFSALPWSIEGDPAVWVEEVRGEIEEAFDRIRREVPLSAAGEAVVARLRGLCAEVESRWKTVRGRAAMSRN